MIVEALAILSILLGGSLILKTLGFTGWALPGLGFLTGLGLQIVIGFILLATSLPNSPVLLIILTSFIPLIIWLRAKSLGKDVALRPVYCLMVVAAVCGLIVLFRHSNLTKWSVDSYSHLQLGSLIAMDKYELTAPDRRMDIPIATAVAHSPATLNNEHFIKSLTPIIGISTLIALAWAFWESSRNKLSKRAAIDYTIVGVLLLASINRFVFNSFYINNHALFAGLLFLIAACSWLLATRSSTISARNLAVFQSILIPALVLTRPESSLIVFLAILPTLLITEFPWKLKAIPLSTLGLSTAVWQGFLVIQHLQAGESVPMPIIAMLLLGLVLMGSAYLLRYNLPKILKVHTLPAIEFGLWLSLLLLGSLHLELIIKSIHSTIINTLLGEGSWGVSLILLTALGILFTATKKIAGSETLRFPVTTFIPIMIGVAFLLGAGYRIGNGDSLNRAIIHVVPIAVLYVVIMASVGVNREWVTRLKRKITSSEIKSV